jgi:hypothetical protein
MRLAPASKQAQHTHGNAWLFGRPPEHLVEQRKASSHSSRPTLLAELSLDASAHAGPVSLADPRRWNGLGR